MSSAFAYDRSRVADAPPRMGVRVKRRGIAQQTLNFCFIALCLFPYGWAPVAIQIAFFATIIGLSTLAGVDRPKRVIWPYVILSALICLRSYLSLDQIQNWSYFISQGNNYWQFVIGFPALCLLARESDWINIIKSPFFLILLVASAFIDVWAFYQFHGAWQIHTIGVPLMFIMVRSYVLQRRGGIWEVIFAFVITAAMLILIVRTTMVMLLAAYVVLLIAKPPPRLLKILCLIAVLAPFMIFLTMDRNNLAAMQMIDFNTYIRAEFIRGSFSYIIQHPFYGVGFDHPYRDLNFAYLTDHDLLRRDVMVNTVSNHNSLYDAALRLGIFAPILVLWLAFVRPKLGVSWNYKPLLMVILCFGMSTNAALEDQRELIFTLVAIAFLNSGRPAFRPRGTRASFSPPAE